MILSHSPDNDFNCSFCFTFSTFCKDLVMPTIQPPNVALAMFLLSFTTEHNVNAALNYLQALPEVPISVHKHQYFSVNKFKSVCVALCV